jgi:hypothetical protein
MCDPSHARFHHILWFGPCGAFSRPGRSIVTPSRAVAVKTGPVQGRRRLGLDGREHDRTLARHGHGRSHYNSLPLNCRARKPIKQRDHA